MYEIESVKADVEHKEPIIVGFFVLQYGTLRMLEMYYSFFQKFCDFNTFEEMEMDTDSLYLALADDSLEDCIKPDMREVWNNFGMNDCSIRELVVPNLSNMINESLDYSRRNFVALK